MFLSRVALVSLLVSSLGLVACSSDKPPPRTPDDEEAQPRSKKKKGNIDSDTDQQLDDILKGLGGGSSGNGGSAKKPPPSTRPTPTPPPAHTGDRDDTFTEDVTKIKSLVPSWDNGTGIGVRFLKESTGKRLSLIYVDPTPPEFKQNKGWLIQAQAKGDGKVLGHYLILIKEVAAGRYEGGPGKNGVVMASLLEPNWKGDAPGAGWSINEGSWCELVLRPGQKPGHFEGDFRAKLVTNEGGSFVTIENGYVYINTGSPLARPGGGGEGWRGPPGPPLARRIMRRRHAIHGRQPRRRRYAVGCHALVVPLVRAPRPVAAGRV